MFLRKLYQAIETPLKAPRVPYLGEFLVVRFDFIA